MRRWTTPTHTIRVKGIDLTGADVWVTYTQGAKTLEVANPQAAYDGEDTSLEVELTQAQTAGFSTYAPVEVQVNWVTRDGKRDATAIKTVAVERNNLDREQGYVG